MGRSKVFGSLSSRKLRLPNIASEAVGLMQSTKDV